MRPLGEEEGAAPARPAAGWRDPGLASCRRLGPLLPRPHLDLLRSVHGLAPQEPWAGRKVDLVCLRPVLDLGARILCSGTQSSSTLQTVVTEDFSHLPPEQQRKRLQQQLEERNRELQKEMDQR